MTKIYLDYAATTPADERVLRAMRPYFSEKFGNPGSLHSFGQKAIAAVDSARDTVARLIGAEFGDVVFTGSATEANNLALSFRSEMSEPLKIVVSAIEHESVLETAREKDGVEVVVVPANKEGFVDLKKLKAALDERTALVSVMYAQNEIGTVQPIAEISKVIKDFNHEILFHTDAVQAFQYLNCNVNELGVDLMTLSAHKIYGPKGIGALYARNANSKFPSQLVSPIVTGGGQEFGLRSGTENVPGIVGFAKAVEIAAGMRDDERNRIGGLRDYFWRELKKIYPETRVNGQVSNVKCLPNILNVYFPGEEASNLLVKFDKVGIAVSAGSACEARSAKPSHVLRAMGFSEERAKSSIRFSFGRFTTKDEIREALRAVKQIAEV